MNAGLTVSVGILIFGAILLFVVFPLWVEVWEPHFRKNTPRGKAKDMAHVYLSPYGKNDYQELISESKQHIFLRWLFYYVKGQSRYNKSKHKLKNHGLFGNGLRRSLCWKQKDFDNFEQERQLYQDRANSRCSSVQNPVRKQQ